MFIMPCYVYSKHGFTGLVRALDADIESSVNPRAMRPLYGILYGGRTLTIDREITDMSHGLLLNPNQIYIGKGLSIRIANDLRASCDLD